MNDDLAQLADDYWQAILDEEPTQRHMLGDYSDVGSYEEVSREAEHRYAATLRDFAARAEAVDAASLDPEEALTRGVIISSATAHADLLETPLRCRNADPVHGLQGTTALLMGLLAVPDQTVAEADAGQARRRRHPLPPARRPHPRGRGGGMGLARPSRSRRPSSRSSARSRSRSPTTRWLPRSSCPTASTPRRSAPPCARRSSGRCGPVSRTTETPCARPSRTRASEEECGLSWLPGGSDAYDATLRYFTTTEKTAQEIHDIGLAQVAKLADEYRALGPEVVGTDDLEEIFAAMRTDPKLHFEHGDELVDQSRIALARAEAAMADWFEVVPQAPCAVQGTEVGAKAFYFPPATDGSRGGTFFVNTDDASAWGRFELEAMAFHEGVPGHHLQLAIASELPDTMPEFRKHLHSSAYAEGWGLYTERLSDEMGLYSAAVDRMGMYSADSMRACRLVVDTGLHALGWSRQQAIDFMVDNSPLTEGVCRPEVDRYICNPGQATSYMIGRLEIQRMRARGRAAAGRALRRPEVPLGGARQRLPAARRARPGGRRAPALSRECQSVGHCDQPPPRLARRPANGRRETRTRRGMNVPTGKVKWYDAEKGFGFLSQDDGPDVYVRNDALPSGLSTLKAGTRVEFGIAQGRRGDQALQVRVLDAPASVVRNQSHARRKTPEEMAPIVEDLIRLLDGVGEAYRHGRHPDSRQARPTAKLLRALADELEL